MEDMKKNTGKIVRYDIVKISATKSVIQTKFSAQYLQLSEVFLTSERYTHETTRRSTKHLVDEEPKWKRQIGRRSMFRSGDKGE